MYQALDGVPLADLPFIPTLQVSPASLNLSFTINPIHETQWPKCILVPRLKMHIFPCVMLGFPTASLAYKVETFMLGGALTGVDSFLPLAIALVGVFHHES
jgi:hypothetical protein